LTRIGTVYAVTCTRANHAVISKEARPAAIRYERIGVSPSGTKYLCNVQSGRFPRCKFGRQQPQQLIIAVHDGHRCGAIRADGGPKSAIMHIDADDALLWSGSAAHRAYYVGSSRTSRWLTRKKFIVRRCPVVTHAAITLIVVGARPGAGQLSSRQRVIARPVSHGVHCHRIRGMPDLRGSGYTGC
jgi:hypothetical protein